jgi:hypothetical protein
MSGNGRASPEPSAIVEDDREFLTFIAAVTESADDAHDVARPKGLISGM